MCVTPTFCEMLVSSYSTIVSASLLKAEIPLILDTIKKPEITAIIAFFFFSIPLNVLYLTDFIIYSDFQKYENPTQTSTNYSQNGIFSKSAVWLEVITGNIWCKELGWD